LGGGLKAQAFYAFDPRANINNSSAALGRHEAYVGLSGGFGSVKLGSPNAASLQAFLASSPLGTATGSSFTNNDHTSASAVGTVRYNNSVRFDTPVMNGVAASLTYAPGNSDALAGGATPSITNLGLTYSNGPLNVVYSSLQTSATEAQAVVVDSVTAGVTTLGTAAVSARVKGTYNFLGANYALGAAKFFVGYGDGDKSTSTGADVKVTRYGATYTMGSTTLIAQQVSTEIGTAAARKATGLRVENALSKRTAAYIAHEAYDQGSAIATGLGSKINTTAVGVRHSF
jgi:hypothetical protein